MTYQIRVDDVLKTRDGQDVRIICIDAKGKFPIVGLITNDSYEEYTWIGDERDFILPAPKTKRVAPYLLKAFDGSGWITSNNWVEKEVAPRDRWLEHLAVDVPDED